MSDLEPEFVWVKSFRREPAIRIPIAELDSYLERGYKIVPIRDQPTEE